MGNYSWKGHEMKLIGKLEVYAVWDPDRDGVIGHRVVINNREIHRVASN